VVPLQRFGDALGMREIKPNAVAGASGENAALEQRKIRFRNVLIAAVTDDSDAKVFAVH
jgi:hypothetical protein